MAQPYTILNNLTNSHEFTHSTNSYILAQIHTIRKSSTKVSSNHLEKKKHCDILFLFNHFTAACHYKSFMTTAATRPEPEPCHNSKQHYRAR